MRRTETDFGQSLQESALQMRSAVEKFAGDVGEALRAFAEQQRARASQLQELVDTARRYSEEAANAAREASLRAVESATTHERVQELRSQLQQGRESLSRLMDDLRGRIAALSVLAAPLPQTDQEQRGPEESRPEDSAELR